MASEPVRARPPISRLGALALAVSLASLAAAPAYGSFFAFESGQSRPLAQSPDGSRLFAVNTPDNRLEVFAIGAGGALTHTGSVPVGLEPIAVAARDDDEVWVVNHLSDSISIVDVAASPPRVKRTLLVCDEPRDVVFAGPGGNRAFVSAARRGQNCPVPFDFAQEGIGRALVQVFDANALGASLGGAPIANVVLFGDTPRALAVGDDGDTVYAAVFHSGNQTAALSEGAVCNGGSGASPCVVDGASSPNGMPGGQVPGGSPPPNTNADLASAPEVGLIVKFDEASGQWRDELGRNWSNGIRFHLPDTDVFAIDASAGTPVETDSFAHVGTILFNMVVNPASGKLYVTNTEARNEVRFEGPGVFAEAFGASTVRGHLHEARVTVVDGSTVTPRHLNKHIGALPDGYRTTPIPGGVADDSLATPLGMAITGDGATLYVAAFGSAKIGVFSTAALETNGFVPDEDDHIPVSGGGPTGLVLDEGRERLYVLTRFDNAVKVIDTQAAAEIAAHPLYNPEPDEVVDGRPFLYDARLTSSNGEASCSSCHVFADFDSLGWDLGNPDEVVLPNPNPPGLVGGSQPFHPMKGPMTTQTLRGMQNHGPMHWRGDRTGGYLEPNADPDGGGFSEELAFEAFNPAFPGLLGRDEGELSAAQMQAFTDFILEVMLPPNPVRSLDNTLDASQQAGQNFYFDVTSDIITNCNGCHEIDPAKGFFGANARTTFENEPQEFKISHLRNAYQKVGMFGMPDVAFLVVADNAHVGDQVRGFGFLHDGSIDTVFHFLRAGVFTGFGSGAAADVKRRQVEDYVMAFDTDLAPVVGQQTTRSSTSGAAVDARIDLLIERASTPYVLKGVPGANECDLVVKGTVSGEARGWLWDAATSEFRADRAADPVLTDAQLRALAATAGQDLTYTCVPPGSGERIALDRDEDGFLDRDELDAGSDPADPASVPGGGPAGDPIGLQKITVTNKLPDVEAKNKVVLASSDASILPPSPGSAGDPRCGSDPAGTVKATVALSSPTSGESHAADLPCEGWRLLGTTARPKGYAYKDKVLSASTAQSVLWKSGKLKVVLSGKGTSTLDYDLQAGVSQDPIEISFAYGAGAELCARCPPTNGHDGSDGKKLVGKLCAAPPSCG